MAAMKFLMVSCASAAALVALSSAPARADLVVLRAAPGQAPSVVDGDVEMSENGKLCIKLAGGGERHVDEADVVAILKGKPGVAIEREKPVEPVDEKPPVDIKPDVPDPDRDKAPPGTIGFVPGRGEGKSGFWPLAIGGRWTRDDGTVQRTIEIVSRNVDGNRTVFKESRETKRPGGRSDLLTSDVIVETINEHTFYMRKDSPFANPVLILVEPVKLAMAWDIDKTQRRVVTKLDTVYTDAAGTKHERCIEIELQSKDGTAMPSATQYFAPGIGLVSDGFRAFTPGKR